MSFQMSRVRGASLYRLVVTRATNIEHICAWLGIDRTALLAANPDLESDELDPGIELAVLASYVQLQLPSVDEAEADLGDQEAEGTASPRISEITEAEKGSDEEEHELAGEAGAPQRAFAPVDPAPAEEPTPIPAKREAAGVRGDQRAYEEAAETAQDEPAPVQALSRSGSAQVVWKPFPKSDLLS